MPVLPFLNLLGTQAGVAGEPLGVHSLLEVLAWARAGPGEDPGKGSEGATRVRASPRQWPQVPGSRGARGALDVAVNKPSSPSLRNTQVGPNYLMLRTRQDFLRV